MSRPNQYRVLYRHTKGLIETKPILTLADFPKPYKELDLWGNGAAHGFLEDALTNIYNAIKYENLLKEKGTHEIGVLRVDTEPQILVATLKVYIE
jgi:hypothetical protein